MSIWFKKSSPIAMQISANVLFQLAGKIVGAGTTLFITLYLARLLGSYGYGDIVKVITYVSAFFIIADFGFNAVYLVDSQKLYTLPSLFFLRILWSFALLFAAYALLRFFPIGVYDGYTKAVRLGIFLYAPSIIFQSIITTANAVFQKYLRYDYSFYAVSFGSIIGLISLYVLSRVPYSPSLIGAGVYLSASFSTALVAFLYMRRLENVSTRYRFSYMKKLFVTSLPIGITLVANLIYAHADSFVLTLTRSTVEVGTYGFAYRFFETLLVVPTFIMNASYPVLLASKKQSMITLKSRYKKLLVSMGLLSVVISVGVWFMAPLLSIVRQDFFASVSFIRILVLSLPLFFLSSLVMWMLFVFNKRWELAFIYVAAMLINIGANVLLVPLYGAYASAWITICSEALVLAATYSVLWRVWGEK